jgi:(1->4)-alpha-D-glucan 1-alpha-D-glucosylmutase
LNREKKGLSNGTEAPTANDEYLLYQTLVGAWPLETADGTPSAKFADRIREYMLKAMREAKDKTSWARPNETYESAVTGFVGALLESKEFLDTFLPFQRKVAFFGMLNSLAQTLIKLTVPGVPDIYQGNELWALNLVDPDNRRPVDYAVYRESLRKIQISAGNPHDPIFSAARELVENIADGRIKLYLIWKTLELRNQNVELFRDGQYIPLESAGEHAKHIIAFARKHEDTSVIAAVPRLTAQLMKGEARFPRGCEVWQDTGIQLSCKSGAPLRNVFTGQSIQINEKDNAAVLAAKELFADFPVALLVPMRERNIQS